MPSAEIPLALLFFNVGVELGQLVFVFTALAGRLIRHEEVSALRWTGVFIIVIGAALVAWSEQIKTQSAAEPHGPT